MKPPNFDAPPMRVFHRDLRRTSDESPYRSACPACQRGLLFVGRDQDTLALVREDACVVCGQHVVYLDDEINGEPLQ